MKGNFELEPFAWESEFTSPFATFWARGFPPANQFSLSEELRAMAKDSWISDKERERILTLRKAGVPVSEIAKQSAAQHQLHLSPAEESQRPRTDQEETQDDGLRSSSCRFWCCSLCRGSRLRRWVWQSPA